LRGEPFGSDLGRESLDSRDTLGKRALMEPDESEGRDGVPLAGLDSLPFMGLGNAADSVGFSSLVGWVALSASEVCGTA